MGNSKPAFWLYWGSMATSSVGTAVTTVALPLLALQNLDASPFEVSLLTAAADVGWLLLGLPAGVIVQRSRIRYLQVSMDVIRALALLSIPVAWWLGVLTLLQMLVVATIVGLATVLFDVANATYLPKIVDKATLVSKNSWISGTHAVSSTGGPSLSGVIVQFAGAVTAVFIDAITYLISALLLRQLPEVERAAGDTPEPAREVITTGLRWVRRHPVMFPAVLWAALTNLVSGAVAALTPIYVIRVLDASPIVVGLVIGAEGVGSLIGAALATPLAARVGTARTLVLTSLGSSAALFLLPLAGTSRLIPLFALGSLTCAVGVVIGSIVTRTHRQTDTPDDLLPMVMASVRFFTWGAIPVGAVGAGALASTTIGVRGALWVTCAIYLLAPLILLASAVRTRRDLSDVPVGVEG